MDSVALLQRWRLSHGVSSHLRRSAFWRSTSSSSSSSFLLSQRRKDPSHKPPRLHRTRTSVSVDSSLRGGLLPSSIETASAFSPMVMFPSQQSSTLSCRTGERWVCFGGGKRLRKPRIWKTKQRRGTISKADKLLDLIQSVSNVKEEVYGALDSFVAWELEFPLIAVKKALRTLEFQGNWIRIIQVCKWMLGKGQGRTLNTYFVLLKAFSEEGRIDEAQELYNKIFMKNMRHTPLRFFLQILKMYKRYEMNEEIIDVFADLEELELKLDTEMVNIVAETYEKLGMSDKAERVRLKYPPSAYRWRSIDGRTKRIPIRQPFIVTKFNPSTQGPVQHEEPYYEHAIVDNAEDGLDVEHDDDDFDEEGYESFEDEKSNDHGSFDDLEFHVYNERPTLKALSGNRTPSQMK